MLLRSGKVKIKNYLYRLLLKLHGDRFQYLDESFDFDQFKLNVLSYVHEMRGTEVYEYKFSGSQSNPDLYSSVYAVMLMGLLGEIDNLTCDDKAKWANYLLSLQSEDGLFRDPLLQSTLSEDCHYWGWHHLAPHMIIALDYLGVKPKYDFSKILTQFDIQDMEEWLATRTWKQSYLAVSNEIMNVGILLQYSRDIFGNRRAGKLVEQMKHWLLNNMRDKNTSLWGVDTDRSPFDISKAIKTAYHVVPLYYYDNDEDDLNIESILRYALKTQNILGGFSPSVISDSCEDIDSAYLLSIFPSKYSPDIEISLSAFIRWVFVNQNVDGGFVFKRYSSFQYADQSQLSSSINQSNMFGTWFRVLSVAFVCNAMDKPHKFIFSKMPGYQYLRGIE